MLFMTVSNYSAVAGIYETTYTALNMGNFKSYIRIYLQESEKKTIQKKSHCNWTQNYAIHPHQKHKKNMSQCCSSISSVIWYILSSHSNTYTLMSL